MIERWTAGAADDYRWFHERDRKVAQRIDQLIEDIKRRPFAGIGKPEPLRGSLAGWWSRRITGEHRLVYRVVGKGAADRPVPIPLLTRPVVGGLQPGLQSRGEPTLQGFRNRDVRTHLFGANATIDRRRSGQVSRLVKRLHLRELVAKIPHSRRWRVTQLGQAVMSAAIQLREDTSGRLPEGCGLL